VLSKKLEAVAGGATRYKAAELMDISERTLKRWRGADGRVAEDLRPEAERVEQSHKLTQTEELAILSACNQTQYRSLPPSQIVPPLADKSRYRASESSFYRVLKNRQQQNYRGRMKPPRKVLVPTGFTATGPNQVWSWDISYCVPGVQGEHGSSNGPRVYLEY